MPRSRPWYPPEFREQMVALVQAGRTPEELGTPLFCCWMKLHRLCGFVHARSAAGVGAWLPVGCDFDGAAA